MLNKINKNFPKFVDHFLQIRIFQSKISENWNACISEKGIWKNFTISRIGKELSKAKNAKPQSSGVDPCNVKRLADQVATEHIAVQICLNRIAHCFRPRGSVLHPHMAIRQLCASVAQGAAEGGGGWLLLNSFFISILQCQSCQRFVSMF